MTVSVTFTIYNCHVQSEDLNRDVLIDRTFVLLYQRLSIKCDM